VKKAESDAVTWVAICTVLRRIVRNSKRLFSVRPDVYLFSILKSWNILFTG